MNPAGMRSPLVRSPLQELAEPPTPPAAGHDDAEQPRRRKLPAQAHRAPDPSPEPPVRRVAPLPQQDTRSRYFAGAGNPSAVLARERLLEPGGRPPIFVPDSDEEEEAARMDWEVAGQPRGREPAHGNANNNSENNGNRNGNGNGKGKENGSSSDFDMGDEDYFNDQAILELADRVEREELALQSQSQTQSQGGTLTMASSATAVQRQTGQSEVTLVASASTSRTAVASSADQPGSSLASRSGSEPVSSATRTSSSVGSRAQSSRPAAQRAAVQVAEADVITIEDSDVDDKENVPVLTRRVRRRMHRPPPSQNPEDIIELSD